MSGAQHAPPAVASKVDQLLTLTNSFFLFSVSHLFIFWVMYDWYSTQHAPPAVASKVDQLQALYEERFKDITAMIRHIGVTVRAQHLKMVR